MNDAGAKVVASEESCWWKITMTAQAPEWMSQSSLGPGRCWRRGSLGYALPGSGPKPSVIGRCCCAYGEQLINVSPCVGLKITTHNQVTSVSQISQLHNSRGKLNLLQFPSSNSFRGYGADSLSHDAPLLWHQANDCHERGTGASRSGAETGAQAQPGAGPRAVSFFSVAAPG